MNVEYIRLNPTQNITLLVLSAVARDIQPLVASALMRLDSGAEQVGFLETPTLNGARARLQMAGGEFCGNASMAAAAYLASLDGLCDGQSVSIRLDVSGADKLVVCSVKAVESGFEGTVDMPLPRAVEAHTLCFNGNEYKTCCVDMGGIVHLVLPYGVITSDRLAEEALNAWSGSFNSEAVGLILFNEDAGCIKPLVYVPSADTLVWERGCGSGSAAVGCCLAARSDGSICINLSQPGGVITVCAVASGGRIESLSITGKVLIDGELRRVTVEI